MEIKACGCHKEGEIHGVHGGPQVMETFRDKCACVDLWMDEYLHVEYPLMNLSTHSNNFG